LSRGRSYIFFLVSVDVDVVVVEVPAAGAVLVPVVEVSVDVIAIPVVVVAVAAVPVSSTTAGCSLVAGVSDVVCSFFWQPVTSAVPNTATRPRVTNFFISLISFF
jgi:hypothetical protein